MEVKSNEEMLKLLKEERNDWDFQEVYFYWINENGFYNVYLRAKVSSEFGFLKTDQNGESNLIFPYPVSESLKIPFAQAQLLHYKDEEDLKNILRRKKLEKIRKNN